MGKHVKKVALKGLMAKVSTKGLGALDGRSAGYRAMVEWKTELYRDLGGEEGLSAQERTLVEVALRTKLFLDHVDLWLMEQESLVNKKRRSMYPVMVQRNTLMNGLLNVLEKLGLKRREKFAGTLADYLEAKRDEHPRSDEGSEIIRTDVPAEEGAV